MATRKRKIVEAALLQKGFALEDDSDHRYYVFIFQGRIIARTKVSRGTKYKDLADDLIAHMSKQCRLTKEEFLNFVDCTMLQEEYEESLRKRQLLE
jgi:hypothetical protein